MLHPKAIGDRATLAVMLGLQEAGYEVSVPFGENSRYDLCVDDGTRVLRVQCKSGRLRHGAVEFATCSCYGHHPSSKQTRRDYIGEIDAFGVFCHETGGVYLVPIEDVAARTVAALRVAPARNGQRSGIRWAIRYLVAEIDLVASGPEPAPLAA